jgi:hypothetical protein
MKKHTHILMISPLFLLLRSLVSSGSRQMFSGAVPKILAMYATRRAHPISQFRLPAGRNRNGERMTGSATAWRRAWTTNRGGFV